MGLAPDACAELVFQSALDAANLGVHLLVGEGLLTLEREAEGNALLPLWNGSSRVDVEDARLGQQGARQTQNRAQHVAHRCSLFDQYSQVPGDGRNVHERLEPGLRSRPARGCVQLHRSDGPTVKAKPVCDLGM